MSIKSCPICYEHFVFSPFDSRSPLKLLCGDIICSKCISSDFTNQEYFCPECGRRFEAENMLEFCEYTSTLFDSNTESCQTSDTSECSSSLSLEMPSLSLFLPNDLMEEEDNVSAKNIPNKLGERRLSVRVPCAIQSCKNKAIALGLCFQHQKNRNVTSVITEVTKQQHNIELSNIAVTEAGVFETRNKPICISPEDIINRFQNQKRIEFGEAMEILNQAKNILSKEPNILRLEAPVMAVGDIHGQFYDLLNLFNEGGEPGKNSTDVYLFLGDYVDRGSFSCEVIFTLLAFKIAYPDKVYLLRGNHECSSVAGHFGFKQECKRKYGINVYYRALLVFQTMPLAAVVSTAFGDIFACHGGLSPKLLTLEDIDNIDRFIEPEGNSGLLDILWSDPIAEDDLLDLSDEQYEEFLQLQWKSNPNRGCSYMYGYHAIQEFLHKNELVCIVRAHEIQEDGFRRHYDPISLQGRLRSIIKSKALNKPENSQPNDDTEVYIKNMMTERDLPPVITVFSAPNYCDRYGNKAAILHIDPALDRLRIIQYESLDHPVPELTDSQTQNYMDAIKIACPYMPFCFQKLMEVALELGPDELLVNKLEKSNISVGTPTPRNNIASYDNLFNSPMSTSRGSLHGKSAELLSPTSALKKRRGSLMIPIVVSNDTSFEQLERVVEETSFSSLDILSPASSTYSMRSNTAKTETSEDHETPNRKSSRSYINAYASDSINDVHPDALSSLIQGLPPTSLMDETSRASSPIIMETSRVSVSELRKRFETNTGNVFANDWLFDENGSRSSFSHSKSLRASMGKTTRKSLDYRSPSLSKSASDSTSISSSFGKKSNHTSDKSSSKETTEPKALRISKFNDLLQMFGGAMKKTFYSSKDVATPRPPEPLKNSHQNLKIQTSPAIKAKETTFNDQISTTTFVEKYDDHIHQNISSEVEDEEDVDFSSSELLALRLMFSLFDRSGSSFIEYDDLVAYAEETNASQAIRNADLFLDYLDIDGDGKIGILDFIHFASRLKKIDLKNADNDHQ